MDETTTAVKARPLTRTGDQVRAILAGAKQFREPVKRQPGEGWTPHSYGDVHKMHNGGFPLRRGMPIVTGWGPSNADGGEAYRCPYGRPGDLLWVREAWAVARCSTDYETGGETGYYEWEGTLDEARAQLGQNARYGDAATLHYKSDGDDVNPTELYPTTRIRDKRAVAAVCRCALRFAGPPGDQRDLGKGRR